LECAAFAVWHSHLHFLPIETGGGEVGRERISEEREGRERLLCTQVSWSHFRLELVHD